MNQTSLNLIAIAVFTITLSALLGPLVHLAPAIPAIVVFGLLGTATVDSFAFQGRGGAVVMDSLAQTSATARERVLHHEAAHFLVAHLLEIEVTGYTLSAWAAWRQGLPGQGGVSFNSQPLEAQLATGSISAQWLNRYCLVWMAGIAAEQMLYGQAQGGLNDRQYLRSLWQALGRSPVECAARERWAILQATTLLQQHETAYQLLVEQMRQRASVAACEQAIAPALATTSSDLRQDFLTA